MYQLNQSAESDWYFALILSVKNKIMVKNKP